MTPEIPTGSPFRDPQPTGFDRSPLRILVVGSVYPRHEDDQEVPWLREMVRQLRILGHEVEVLAPAHRGLASHNIDGVRVHRFRYALPDWEILTHDEGAPSKIRRRPWLKVLGLPYVLSGAWHCWRLASQRRYSLVQANWPFPHALIVWPASRILSIPVVCTFHGAELSLARTFPWVAGVLHWILGWSSADTANSSYTAQLIRAIRTVEVSVIPYGHAAGKRELLPGFGNVARDELATQKPRILFVGRQIARKGIIHLIHAVARPQLAARCQLRLVGEGDRTSELRAEANRVSADIVFTGKLSADDLRHEYERATVFVLPAVVDGRGDTEGLGVVLLEAIEFGVPIVASAVGGIVDVIKDHTTGLLVPPGDPEALAAAITELLENPFLATSLAEHARQHAGDHFSWTTIGGQWDALFRRVVSDNGR